MKRFNRLALVSAISMGLAGLSGSAFAVNNGDFEDPPGATPGVTAPTDWTGDGYINNVIPHGGSQYLALGFDQLIGIDQSASAWSYADEDLTGCSPYGLGEWAAAGWYQTYGDDTASFTVDFDAGPSSATTDLTGGNGAADGWVEVTDNGNISEFATWARVIVGGTALNEEDGTADAIWDDVSFTPDCVTDYAKISGKFKDPSLEGEGGLFQRGWVSFDGAFGHLESGKLVGSLYWNDKKAGVSCTALPDPADFYLYDVPAPNDDYEAVYAITYTCSEGTEGKALFFFDEDGGAGYGGKGKNKYDRGCWKLSNYETDSSPDLYELYDCLDNGNVDVMPPPEV